jgi:hypothetical protein
LTELEERSWPEFTEKIKQRRHGDAEDARRENSNAA